MVIDAERTRGFFGAGEIDHARRQIHTHDACGTALAQAAAVNAVAAGEVEHARTADVAQQAEQ